MFDRSLGTPVRFVCLISFAVWINAGRTAGMQVEQRSSAIGPVDVAPEGWRRTTYGWERAEDWETSWSARRGEDLNRLIRLQSERENESSHSRLVAKTIGLVQRMDPVTLVSTQLCLLALLFFMVFHREAAAKRKLKPS